jgi:hypothetical protein
MCHVRSVTKDRIAARAGTGSMSTRWLDTKWLDTKWIGPIVLLAALVIGDQIRINRPGHKYRLTVEVETSEGVKSASGIMAVFPDRGYSRGAQTKGDAVFVDLGAGKNLVALLAQIDKSVDLDGMNYLALRAYRAAGRDVSFNGLSKMTGAVPVTGVLIPVLLTFGNPNDPLSAHAVAPEDPEKTLGGGFRLHGISVEAVPNGFWPLDLGGSLGEPVTRGIEARLPWLSHQDDSAATALRAAELPGSDAIDARQAFERK